MRKTQVLINKKNLIDNLNFIKSQSKVNKHIAIVKANAYGHGAVEIAKLLSEEGIFAFGVAYTEEAVILRKAGIKEPIIILVQQAEEDIPDIVEYDLQPAVSTVKFLETLNQVALSNNKKIKVHLFVDTGMSRDGVASDEVLSFMNEATKLKNIEFEGICSHFSSASLDPVITQFQLDAFTSAIDILKQNNYTFNLIHTASSAAIVNYENTHFNAVRFGIALYGYAPDTQISHKFNVKPVLTLKSNISLIRRIKKGDSVSYSRRYIADRDTNIATVPLGYGDGYPRALTGKAFCIINDKMYPIVGSICMDELMVNLGDDELKVGDEVILIGSSPSHTITADDVAGYAGTISYEITTLIAPRVPRIYV